MIETTFENLFWHTPVDADLFQSLTRGLPDYPANWPFGLGAHSMRGCAMATHFAPPTMMLEIGFNLGRSAAIWLGFCDEAHLVSVDINPSPLVAQAGDVLRKRYPSRFSLVICNSEDRFEALRYVPWDLIFIDGEHDHASVLEDINLARRLGIKRMLFDDWNPHTGPGVQSAVLESGLKIIAVFGNLGYCIEKDATWIK